MNPSPINVIIGEQRMGLFKPLEDKVFITTPNSYIEFDKSQFIVIDNTPSPYTYLGLGAVGGLSIAILLGFLIN
jgi:hypothetical protein